jgi:hypothetical protein
MSLDYQKIATEIIILGVTVVVFLLLWPYLNRRGVEEAVDHDEEMHLKRLFGPAWKEARDL